MTARGGAAPCAVVDTNILLDCWVFDDAAARPLWQAVLQRRLGCLRTAATDAELLDVLGRPVCERRLAARAMQPGSLLAQWRDLAQLVDKVFAAPWRCTDPHDQKFLDLAVSARAQLLVTKDKALLKLARRARRDGLAIVPVATALEHLARVDAAD